MAKTEVIIQVLMFIALVYSYAKLCLHRQSGFWGKLAEITSLYGWSIWTILGQLKFGVWALGIGVIGVRKILTTKKIKSEGRNKGLVS